MKRNIVGVVCAVFFAFSATLVYAQHDNNRIMEELNKELRQEKVFLPGELKDMDKSLRNSLEHGVKKEDLKTILLDLKNNQAKAKDAKVTIDVMVDLIKSGVSVKEAGNIVSQAAHQAKAQGLKGADLAARVHEAIQARKAQQEKLTQQHKHQKQIETSGAGKDKEQEKESHGKSKGRGGR